MVLFLRSFFFIPCPPPSLGKTCGLFPLLVFRIPEVAEKRRKRRTSRRFTMDATLETIARWKTTTRGTSACKVLELNVRGKTVGEALVALQNSGHESLPTGAETSSTMTMVSIRSFSELFARELKSDLERPHEPGVSDAPRASGLDETDVAETLGVVTRETTSEDERKGASETIETRRSTFEKTLSLPASALMSFCREIKKKSPNTNWSECLESFRDDGVVFFADDDFDETTRRVVTAEDVVFFLGIEDVLRRAFDPACYDEKHLFDSCKSTYIVVRAEHASGCSVASCFGWLFERRADACVFVESACRVPGVESSHGVVVSEICIRDVVNLTPKSFQRIFATSAIDFARSKPKSAGACTRAFVGSHDGGVDDARETIAGYVRKKPDRLPRRFYLYIDGRIQAFTPVSLLATLLAADANR